MMITLQSYARRVRLYLRRQARNPQFQRTAQAVAYFLTGFVFSAASIGNAPMTLAVAVVCACNGWSAVLSALGGMLGYWVFWGEAGFTGLVCLTLGLPICLVFSDTTTFRKTPLLVPMIAGVLVAAVGVIFQVLLQDMTPIPIYLLRIATAVGGCYLFSKILQGRNAILDWLGLGLLVLSLAQIAPWSYFGLGFFAAGILCGAATFPASVLAGLALDLAQITPIPMTAVLALGYLVRFLPRYPKVLGAVCLPWACIAVMAVSNIWDFRPLLPLLAGSLWGVYLPTPGKFAHRRGETGVAQVRLELAAGVLNQTEDLLREVVFPPIDEEALMIRAADRACGGCACRKNCRDSGMIRQQPPALLHKPLLSTEELPVICRKPGRYLSELHRCQEQLRAIRADRQRQEEYRMAVVQQYSFLAEFLQDLADKLPQRPVGREKQFTPDVTLCGNRYRYDNGDQCRHFAGVGNLYYVLLCDGMGTGPGAVQEGKTAVSMLQKLLLAGYPAEHALKTLNSLCALRERAGAVTVDLAEVHLDSGKTNLYKWGSPPSYLVTTFGAERLGTPGAPPGVEVTQPPRQSQSVSLRKGEWLVLVSDGVGQREALRCCTEMGDGTPKDLAVSLLSYSNLMSKGDDATVAVIRLKTRA